MEHLTAPWRKQFIERTEKEEGCIFCTRKSAEPSRESLVLCHFNYSFILLNKYPYNNGHLMVAPYRHTADFAELEPDEKAELGESLLSAVDMVKKAYAPQGFNIGMNLGSVAGAGVADHMHWHIVPRWNGDTNFMPVTGQTKVLHEMLAETFEKLMPFAGPLK